MFSHVSGLGDLANLEPVDQFSSGLRVFNSPLTSTPSHFNIALPVQDDKSVHGPVALECVPSTSKAPKMLKRIWVCRCICHSQIDFQLKWKK